MKILVTGVKGQLGYDIVRVCKKNNINAIGVDVEDMDITKQQEVSTFITQGEFDAVIHCAAWTAVDKAEEEKENVFKVNVEGTRYIANMCEKLEIPMMYFSTDYVFNGTGEESWKEYAKREPLNVYGQSKYEGELIVEKLKKHFIVRISWVFGINGNNFIKTMLRLGKEKGKVSVVNDQIGAPTYTFDLAKLCIEMIQTQKYGTYHATNRGDCSWFEFAQEIFKQAKMDVKVTPVTSDAFVSKAKRPMNSRLSKDELTKQGFMQLPEWKDALSRYLIMLDKEV